MKLKNLFSIVVTFLCSLIFVFAIAPVNANTVKPNKHTIEVAYIDYAHANIGTTIDFINFRTISNHLYLEKIYDIDKCQNTTNNNSIDQVKNWRFIYRNNYMRQSKFNLNNYLTAYDKQIDNWCNCNIYSRLKC